MNGAVSELIKRFDKFKIRENREEGRKIYGAAFILDWKSRTPGYRGKHISDRKELSLTDEEIEILYNIEKYCLKYTKI